MKKSDKILREEAIKQLIAEGILDGDSVFNSGWLQGIFNANDNTSTDFQSGMQSNTPGNFSNSKISSKASETLNWVKTASFSTSKGYMKYAGGTKHYCGAGVAGILHHMGFNIMGQDANQMGPTIQKVGFQPIASLNISANDMINASQSGDIVIIKPFANHTYGHIEIRLGNTWVSDFIQNSGNPYEQTCNGTLYRYIENEKSQE